MSPRPTRTEIEALIKTYSGYGSDSAEQLRRATNKISGWLDDADNDLEAPALRKELHKALRAKVDMEAQLVELNARLDLATDGAAPIIIMPGAFVVGPREGLDPALFAKGVPFIFTDDPVPVRPATVTKAEVDETIRDFKEKRRAPDPDIDPDVVPGSKR